MEIAHLRALRELGERGSIAAVAAARRVTASSVSQQITALQRLSPVPLTARSGRRTVLTAAGQALADAAVGVEVAMTRADETIQGFRDDAAATVSVAAFHSAGLAMFPRLLASASEGGPQVTLTDFDVAQTEFPTLTADHDLVLAHRLAGSAAWPGGVRTEPLFYEPLDIAVRADHPLAAAARVHPAQLRGERWVAVHEGFPLERAVGVIATLSGADPIVAHRINDFLTAAAVVVASGCVALLPRYSVDLRHLPGIVRVPLDVAGIGRHVDCLARPETLERRAVRTVLSGIRSIATDLSVELPDEQTNVIPRLHPRHPVSP